MELRVVEVKRLMLSEARPAAETLQACGNAASLTSEPHVSVSIIVVPQNLHREVKVENVDKLGRPRIHARCGVRIGSPQCLAPQQGRKCGRSIIHKLLVICALGVNLWQTATIISNEFGAPRIGGWDSLSGCGLHGAEGG